MATKTPKKTKAKSRLGPYWQTREGQAAQGVLAQLFDKYEQQNKAGIELLRELDGYGKRKVVLDYISAKAKYERLIHDTNDTATSIGHIVSSIVSKDSGA